MEQEQEVVVVGAPHSLCIDVAITFLSIT
jgi:hypothetical protein